MTNNGRGSVTCNSYYVIHPASIVCPVGVLRVSSGRLLRSGSVVRDGALAVASTMFRPSPSSVLRAPISRVQCAPRPLPLRSSRQLTTTRPRWNQENQQHKQRQSFTGELPLIHLSLWSAPGVQKGKVGAHWLYRR